MDEKSSDQSRVLSEKKMAANRANAQHSTGPRTPEGKARSRLNSIKHGLLAIEAVNRTLDGDAARAQFDALVDRLEEHFQPADPIEEFLVENIAIARWRQKRLMRFETRSTLESQTRIGRVYRQWSDEHEDREHPQITRQRQAGVDGLPMPHEVDAKLLLRYEAAASRDFYRAFNDLKKLQKERKQHPEVPGDGAAQATAQDDSSEPENENFQTNPPNPELKLSDSTASRKNGEDPVVGTSSG